MSPAETNNQECKSALRAVSDAMDVLGGKWKIHIITALCFTTKRFSDLLSDITGISGKMLSRELKEMEMNKLITRTVANTQPLVVEYTLTPYAQKLMPVIQHLADWGTEHRKMILGKTENSAS